VLNILSVSVDKHPVGKAHAPYYIVIYVMFGCTTFFHII